MTLRLIHLELKRLRDFMEITANLEWAKKSPYERFFDFIAMDADRFGILLEQLEKYNLNSLVVTINGNRHIFIFPNGVNLKLTAGDKFPFRGKKPVILAAHYDRVPGSPGANDNSVAVFLLLKAALYLNELGKNNWIIIFTDKEELKRGEKIKDQGSFSLTKKLVLLGLVNAQIFNFDACGSGNTFVFSNTVDYLLRKKIGFKYMQTGKTIAYLKNKALITANYLNLKNVLLAPVPFSDDAGFLRGGIPAQTITMLPTDEAKPFAFQLLNQFDFAEQIILNKVKDAKDKRFYPQTWRYLNSPYDTYLHLTPEYFEKIVRFAVELCR